MNTEGATCTFCAIASGDGRADVVYDSDSPASPISLLMCHYAMANGDGVDSSQALSRKGRVLGSTAPLCGE
jgi:hypothetical protein